MQNAARYNGYGDQKRKGCKRERLVSVSNAKKGRGRERKGIKKGEIGSEQTGKAGLIHRLSNTI